MTYPQPLVPISLPPSLTLRRRSLEVLDAVLCAAYVLLGAVVAWTLAFGPTRLHDTPSLQLVAGLGLHWRVIAALFAGYALLLMTRWTRVLGWGLGMLLFGYYLASLTHSIYLGNAGSALAIAAAVAAVLSQSSGMARSMIAAEWRGK